MLATVYTFTCLFYCIHALLCDLNILFLCSKVQNVFTLHDWTIKLLLLLLLLCFKINMYRADRLHNSSMET